MLCLASYANVQHSPRIVTQASVPVFPAEKERFSLRTSSWPWLYVFLATTGICCTYVSQGA